MCGMVLFIFNNPKLIPYTLFCSLTLAYLFFTYLIGLLGKDFNDNKHRSIVTRWIDRSFCEEIDILLPVCGEHIDIIRNTWDYVKKLKEAHEGKILVHVLDDSKNDEIKSLAEQFKFNYITRENNHLKKAGNLRNAFVKTSAPYFIILDADFAPRDDFIINIMPYFYEDLKVGIVQSPQFFDVTNDQTSIQKGAGAVQELFYRLIQVNRDTFNGAICVGSNAIYSRKHLKPFGGTADIGYSEDVRTAYRLSMVGDRVKYIPINLAAGTCPETWQQYFTQLYRWSMGSLDLMLSKEFWVKGITKMQRVCYMTGMLYYLTTGLSVIFGVLPSIYLLIYRPEFIYWFNLMFSVPSFFLSIVFMRMWQKLPYNMDSIRARHVASYAHLYAFKDLLLDMKEAWIPTGAKTSSKRYDSFCIFFIFMTLATPLIIFSLIGLRIYEGHSPYNFILLILFTSFNLYIAAPIIDDL